MKTKAVGMLIAAAVLIGAAALIINRGNGSGAPSGGGSGATIVPTSLFPDLKTKVNDVASIEVKRPGETFSIVRGADGWGLASKGGYPVQVEQVKGSVMGLAQLKPVEAKTSNPDLYSKIGVQDPGDKPAGDTPPANPEEAPPTQPTLVTLKDDKGAVLASVVVGTQKWGNTPSIFVRKAGDKQSWLAEGRLEVPTDAMQWVERQVLNIGKERIKSVVVLRPSEGTEVEVSRADAAGAFTLANMPAGRELSAPTAPETLVTGVQYFSIDDVQPLDQVSFAEPTAIAVFKTFDGLVVTARTVTKDAKQWVNLTFSSEAPPPTPAETPTDAADATKPPEPAKPPQKTPEEVKKEADELTGKLSKWAFAVGEYKAKNLTATIETLLKPLPEPAPSPVAPEEPGLPGPQPGLPTGG